MTPKVGRAASFTKVAALQPHAPFGHLPPHAVAWVLFPTHAEYRLMSRFVRETANMPELVRDALNPRDFEVFVKYSFDEQPKT